MKKILLFLLLSIAGYGQIVPTGQEQDFDYGIRNTVSQLDDNAAFITVQDATGVQGKSTSSVWAKKIYVDNADVKKSFLSTGLIKNGLVQTNADPTKFNITAGIGIISNFDNPEIPTSTIVSFPSFTGITPAYLTTGNITYVAINSSGAVVMQASAFTSDQRRDLIVLGAVIHSNLSTINLVNNISAPTNAGTNQLHDLYEFIGALNLTGNKYTSNGANLSLDKTAGTIGKLGVNFANNWKDPNRLSIGLQTLLTFRYRTQDGTEGSDVTVLNPAVYDLANVLTAVPVNRFSIQTVTIFQTGQTRIQYGQSTYATLAEAEAAILTRSYVVESNIAMNGIVRAYVILRHNATDLTNTTTSKIVEAQKFGGVASGGAAITDAAIIAALGYTPANDVDVVKLTGGQTVAGIKTFTDNIIVGSSNTAILGLSGGVEPTLNLVYPGVKGATLQAANTTGYRTMQAPDDSGTLALREVYPIETGTSFSLDNTYTGKIVIFTSSCTLTIPNGLQAGFNATFVTLAGVTLTVSTGGSVVLFNNVGTTMLEKSSFTLQARTTTNNYITAGAL